MRDTSHLISRSLVHNPVTNSNSSSQLRSLSAPNMVSPHQSWGHRQSSQMPSSVSVKNNKDGTKEVVVETSVKMSYTFKKQGQDRQLTDHTTDFHISDYNFGWHHFPPQEPLELSAQPPGHQLVCCTCMMSLPSLQVGECGCLACSVCMAQQVMSGYCNHCQAKVRYTGLERIIKFPDKGQMGAIFMTTREREGIKTKDFINRVIKQESDFKVVDKILNKQEAAIKRMNSKNKEGLDRTLKEKKELDKKILAKSSIISDLERNIRSSLHQFQHYNDNEPRTKQCEAKVQIQYQDEMTTKEELQFQPETRPRIEYQGTLHIQHEEARHVESRYDTQNKEARYDEENRLEASPKIMKPQVQQRLQLQLKKRSSIAPSGVRFAAGAAPSAGLKSILKNSDAVGIGSCRRLKVESGQELGRVKTDSGNRVGGSRRCGGMGQDINREDAVIQMQLGKDDPPIKQSTGTGNRGETDPTVACRRGLQNDMPNTSVFTAGAEFAGLKKSSSKRNLCPEHPRQMTTASVKKESSSARERGGQMNTTTLQFADESRSEFGFNDKVEKMTSKKEETAEYKRKIERTGHKPALVSAASWMDRTMRGSVKMSTTNMSSMVMAKGHIVEKERLAIVKVNGVKSWKLSALRNPRTNPVTIGCDSVVSNGKKEKMNMTYDYLDMIVSRDTARCQTEDSGSVGEVEAVEEPDVAVVQLRQDGFGVAGGNSQLFWDQYLM